MQSMAVALTAQLPAVAMLLRLERCYLPLGKCVTASNSAKAPNLRAFLGSFPD